MKEASSSASTSTKAETASRIENNTTTAPKSTTPISNNYDDDDDLSLDEIDIAPPPELPTVIPGSQSWHRDFPNEWLSIIARDIRHQEQVKIIE